MEKNSKIYVAGHMGLVGSGIKRKLEEEGYRNLVLRTHSQLDLRNQKATEDFFVEEKPDYVIDAAAKVGGIQANDNHKVKFLCDNLQIQNNLITSSYKSGVKKLLFLGSSCMYPKECPQPMKEGSVLTGKPEPTNKAFSIAKIAGAKLCQYYSAECGANFISAVPNNLFGPRDNFDLENSHFVPGMIRRFHEATVKNLEKVVIMGTGTPRREIMHVDDLADAVLFLMQNYDSPEIINVGGGEERTIKEFSELIKEIVGFRGRISLNKEKPDGVMRKLLDSSKITALGWKPKISLEDGLERIYEWFLENYEE